MMIHNPDTDALEQMLSGILAAHPGKFTTLTNLYSHTLLKQLPQENRVQIIISGGGGYGPMFAGFVGEGLADAMLEGDFDCAPNAYALYEVGKAMHRGKGILYITNNFTGDFLNNDMARELLCSEGIEARVCYVSDDLFSARGESKEKRGGLCGIGLLMKVAAAAADKGLPLEEVFRLVEKANARLRSVTALVDEKAGTLAFGAGFSGEAPPVVVRYESARALAEQAVDFILGELEGYEGAAYFTVNRTRAMSYLEGYVVLDDVCQSLKRHGRAVAGCSAGGYFDAFHHQNGCIISVLVADAELAEYVRPVTDSDFSI